ncbi:MAG: hypothetical protein Roseis2KO_44240 [Roseivirga sp.]
MSAQNTITFDDQSYVHVEDLNDFSIINNGRTFEFSSVSNSNGYEYRTRLGLNTTAYTAGAVMITGLSSTLAKFKTADGSEFDLQSFIYVSDFANFPNSDHNLTVTGYKDNVAVSGAVYSTNISAVNNLIDLSGDDDFNDVDEIRLTNNGTGNGQHLDGGGFDNVIWIGAAGTDTPATPTNFEFTDATDNGTTVTEEVNGVTMTVSGGTPDIFNSAGFYANFSQNAVWTSTAVSTITVSFSTAIDITSAAFADGNLGSHTFVITPTGGTNSAVNVSASGATAGVATLNWTGVTSFTVTKLGGGNVTFAMDNILLPEVAADPIVTLTVSDNNPGEGDGSVTITATADVAPSADLTVNLSYSGTAAGSGTDFTEVSSIVISSGTTSNTGTLNITSDTDAESDETIIIDISSLTGVTATEGGPNQQTVTIANDDYAFSIKVFLEGPLSGTTMSTTLNTSLPANPSTIYTNTLSETSGGIPATAVDWVEVELRTGTAAGTKTGTNRGAILKSDGSLVDKDGNTFTMSQADGTSYFIVIHHRNHLSVMSNAVVAHSSGTYTFDFTTAQANNYNNGSDGAIQVGSVFAMFAGDADDSGTIDGTDLTAWRAQNGAAFTYASNGKSDLNMDGVINAVDRNGYQQKNNTKTSQVPST